MRNVLPMPGYGPARVDVVPATQAVLDRFVGWAFALLVTLLLIGYPIAGSMAQILNLESTAASYPFRGLVILVSAIIFVLTLARREYQIVLVPGIFLVAYTLRLIFDSQSGLFPDSERDFLFFIASVFVPTLALGGARYFDERKTAILLCTLGTLACAMIVIGVQSADIYDTDVSFSKRAVFEALNPITIGYTGLYTAAAGFVMYLRRGWGFRLWIALPLIAIGLWVMVLGGSRGPLVAAFLFLAIFAFTRTSGILALFFALLIGFAVFYLVGQDLAIVQRFTDFSIDQSVWERIYVQRASMDAALANPIFGSSYLEPISLAYPHNLLIESAMALGVFGLALMVMLQVRLALDAFILMRSGQVILPFIAVCALANAYLSAALFASVEIYAAAILLRIAVRMKQQNEVARQQFPLSPRYT